MAQPDYRRLADAFNTAAQECALLPNIPLINDSQRLIDAIEGLRQTTEAQNTLLRQTTEAQITLLRQTTEQQMARITQQIAGLQTDITSRLDAR